MRKGKKPLDVIHEQGLHPNPGPAVECRAEGGNHIGDKEYIARNIPNGTTLLECINVTGVNGNDHLMKTRECPLHRHTGSRKGQKAPTAASKGVLHKIVGLLCEVRPRSRAAFRQDVLG